MSRRKRQQAQRAMAQRRTARDQQRQTAEALARVDASGIDADCTHLEAERQYAVLIREQYGCLPLSDPFYMRHLGLADTRWGSQNDLRHDEMPDVIRPEG